MAAKKTGPAELHIAKLAAVGKVARNLGHDINNPLAIISGHADRLVDILQSEKLVNGERVFKGLDHIRDGVQRIVKLVKGMQIYAKDSINGKAGSYSLGSIADSTKGLCELFFHGKNIKVTFNDFPRGDSYRCRGPELSFALFQLVANGCEAAAESTGEKWVRVDIESKGGRLQFAVTDSGPGLPAEMRAKIAQPYFTTKDESHGFGLGLNLARTIVQAHDGELVLDPGGPNTKFVLRIPIKENSDLLAA